MYALEELHLSKTHACEMYALEGAACLSKTHVYKVYSMKTARLCELRAYLRCTPLRSMPYEGIHLTAVQPS